MELIRRAVERARSGTSAGAAAGDTPAPRLAPDMVPPPPMAPPPPAPMRSAPPKARINATALDSALLERHRIVAHDLANPIRKSFDILRTQVLQAMDEKDLHLIAVTSPSPGCGKTVTAINLALSIARQPHRSALLIDMDLQRPKIANYLGLPADKGLLAVLDGQLSLADATIQARIGGVHFSTLLAEGTTEDSSRWMASQAMTKFLQEVRSAHSGRTVIVDLPPMLTSDDVMMILPQIDCVLFVAAAGASTRAEIEDCSRQLETTEIVRIVLNKASEVNASYAGAYY